MQIVSIQPIMEGGAPAMPANQLLKAISLLIVLWFPRLFHEPSGVPSTYLQ